MAIKARAVACCIAWPEGRNCNWNPDKSTPHPLQTNQMLTNVWGNLLWGTLSGLLLIFARDLRPEKVCTEKATGGRQGLKADTSPRDWNILKPRLVFQHAPCSLPHLQNQNGLAQKIEPPEWVVSLFRKPSKRAPQNSSQGPKERSGEFGIPGPTPAPHRLLASSAFSCGKGRLSLRISKESSDRIGSRPSKTVAPVCKIHIGGNRELQKVCFSTRQLLKPLNS